MVSGSFRHKVDGKVVLLRTERFTVVSRTACSRAAAWAVSYGSSAIARTSYIEERGFGVSSR